MEDKRILVIAGIGFVLLMLFFGWCYTKKSPKVEKWGWRIMGLLMAVFVVFTLWYHVPIRCKDHVQVVDIRTQKEEVIVMELFIRRSYLNGTRVSGWISTPQDTYGTYGEGALTRDKGRYHCNALFKSDVTSAPSFDNSIHGLTVGFSRGFEDVTYLDLLERRLEDEWYWYQTPAKP